MDDRTIKRENITQALIDRERLGRAVKDKNGIPRYVPFETDTDVMNRLQRDYYLSDDGTTLISYSHYKSQIKLNP